MGMARQSTSRGLYLAYRNIPDNTDTYDWSGDDEYQYLYDYYENKYPEYNHQLKHYGK